MRNASARFLVAFETRCTHRHSQYKLCQCANSQGIRKSFQTVYALTSTFGDARFALEIHQPPFGFKPTGCARSAFSHVSSFAMASSKAWREIWVRPEVRPSRARCPSRTRVVRGRVRPRRRTLNCFLARVAHPTHANRAPRPRSPALTVPRPSLRAQVYPIWAAIGGAVSLSAFFCTRQITTSPGFRCVSSQRQRPSHLGCPGRYSAASARPARTSPGGRAVRAPRCCAHPAGHRTRCASDHVRASRNGSRSGRVADLLFPSPTYAFPFRRVSPLV